MDENSTEFYRTNDTARDVIITPINRVSNNSRIMINVGSELDEMRYQMWFSDDPLQHTLALTSDVFHVQNTSGMLLFSSWKLTTPSLLGFWLTCR